MSNEAERLASEIEGQIDGDSGAVLNHYDAMVAVQLLRGMATCCQCPSTVSEHCPEMHTYDQYKSGFRCPKRAHHSFVQHRGARP